MANWKPINFSDDFWRIDREVQQFMECIFGSYSWKPSVDVYETDKEIVVLVEIAGVNKEDIEVFIQGNIVTVRGNRKEPDINRKEAYYQMEINYGTFERVIPLPTVVREEEAKASFQNGILKIVFPKTTRITNIPIEEEGNV
ncbi:Hsp20/alpha crystallin family protein [bacterium]|nr:Hsp20/alpha crystallin family protein [bacterium]